MTGSTEEVHASEIELSSLWSRYGVWVSIGLWLLFVLMAWKRKKGWAFLLGNVSAVLLLYSCTAELEAIRYQMVSWILNISGGFSSDGRKILELGSYPLVYMFPLYAVAVGIGLLHSAQENVKRVCAHHKARSSKKQQEAREKRIDKLRTEIHGMQAYNMNILPMMQALDETASVKSKFHDLAMNVDKHTSELQKRAEALNIQAENEGIHERAELFRIKSS